MSDNEKVLARAFEHHAGRQNNVRYEAGTPVSKMSTEARGLAENLGYFEPQDDSVYHVPTDAVNTVASLALDEAHRPSGSAATPATPAAPEVTPQQTVAGSLAPTTQTAAAAPTSPAEERANLAQATVGATPPAGDAVDPDKTPKSETPSADASKAAPVPSQDAAKAASIEGDAKTPGDSKPAGPATADGKPVASTETKTTAKPATVKIGG